MGSVFCRIVLYWMQPSSYNLVEKRFLYYSTIFQVTSWDPCGFHGCCDGSKWFCYHGGKFVGKGRKQRNNSTITSQFMSWSSKLPKACQPFEVHLGTLNQTWVHCCCTLPLMIKWWKYMYELFLRICSYGDVCWVTNILSKRFVIDTHLLAVLILQW